MADTLIVLPTYNEIDNLEIIVGRIRQAVPQADILIVDDSSPDGTGELAKTLSLGDPGITVLHRLTKDGLGGAYRAGFALASERGYSYVVEIDADGSHDPGSLPEMIALAKAGADLVIGSRWVPGGEVRNWPWLRQLISRSGNVYSRAVLGSKIRDLTSGFRVIRTSTLNSTRLASISSQGYCFQVELAWRLEQAGAIVAEHPIVFVERTLGRSKMHSGIVLEALWRVTLWGIAQKIPRRE
ncbi:MAG: polyprenol monophosphomannose synthase [Microbacteriaceae bacterium]|nr:polyprenol monophosphomannose synthase [Microbacteriaceae bacterium]